MANLTFSLTCLGCLCIAFAKPFKPNSTVSKAPNQLVIYIDNSFSMQAQGERGNLVQQATQEIIGALDDDDKITLITNDNQWGKMYLWEVSKMTIRNPFFS